MSLLKKILIVEDEKPLANSLALKLIHAGYEIRLAHDGKEAIDIIKKEKFNLVLLDLIMPKMNGFEVLKKLKKIKNSPPVLVTSNLGQEEDINKTIEEGAVGHFYKSDYSIANIVNEAKKYIK